MRTRSLASGLLMLGGTWAVSEPEFTIANDRTRIVKGNYTAAPYHIHPATWGRLMANPNATGHFPFDGPDITSPYPASNVTGHSSRKLQWAISLDLKADISLEQTEFPQTFNTSSYVSGGVLSLTPPDDMVNPSLDAGKPYQHHRTWKTCLYGRNPPEFWGAKFQKKMHDEDSCEAVWSDECVDWIKAAISERFRARFSERPINFGGGASDLCPFVFMDGPCSSTLWMPGTLIGDRVDYNAMYSPWNMTLAEEKVKVKSPKQPLSDEISYKNGSAVFQWASHWGDKGNLTAYNQETGLYWPLFVVFGYNETWMAEDYNSSNRSFPPDPLIEFLCVKPQKAAPGSKLPQSAASLSSSVSGGILLFVVSLIVAAI